MRGAESLGKPLTHGGRVLRFAGKTGDHTHSNRSLRGKPFRSEKGFASMKLGIGVHTLDSISSYIPINAAKA